jgi:hypothetical protein
MVQTQLSIELLQLPRVALTLDDHTAGVVAYETLEMEPLGNPVDERAKTDALHLARYEPAPSSNPRWDRAELHID